MPLPAAILHQAFLMQLMFTMFEESFMCGTNRLKEDKSTEQENHEDKSENMQETGSLSLYRNLRAIIESHGRWQ